MDSNHRYPRERSLLLPRSELAFEARVAIPGGLIEEVRFARDSPLEEGVYCELVSESEISEVSIPVRFWAILVS